MITEAIFRAFWGLTALIDQLIPPVPWPSWFGNVVEFWEAFNVGSSLVGLFVFIHPVTYDVIALSIVLRATLAVVNRLRQMVSVATGGGVDQA